MLPVATAARSPSSHAGREQGDVRDCRARRARAAELRAEAQGQRDVRGTTASTRVTRAQVVLAEYAGGVRGNAAANASIRSGGSTGRPRRGARRSAPGARRMPQSTVQVERGDRAARSLPFLARAARSGRPAGDSAPPGARRRSRSRPRATPRRRGRRPAGCASPPATPRPGRSRRGRSVLDPLSLAVQLLEPSASDEPPASGRRSAGARARPPGCPRRPAALIRGASRKPTAPESTTAGSTRAAAHERAAAPVSGRGEARSPAIASARFSSTSGTTSAMVASETMSA